MERFEQNPDFLQELFIEETWKHIEKLDSFIEHKQIQQQIQISGEEINGLFRTMHSIKGTSSMMGYPAFSETAHSAEDLFAYLKEKSEPEQKDLKEILKLLRLVSGYMKRELRRMETGDEVTDFGWAVVRRIKNFLAHVEDDHETEPPNVQISYTRKGKQRIPFTNFQTLVAQMERLASVMGHTLDKEFVVRVSGADTEVPRDLYDKISMAVIQMMKNSIDHGLESTIDREKMGKTPVGEISLEIQKTIQEVLVIFRDDGIGLNKESILEEAAQKGWLEKEPSEYEDYEAYAFLLRSGFTTKKHVTLFSGRGIGLDVVHAAVCVMGGHIRIESKQYMGTTFFIEFPLSYETKSI